MDTMGGPIDSSVAAHQSIDLSDSCITTSRTHVNRHRPHPPRQRRVVLWLGAAAALAAILACALLVVHHLQQEQRAQQQAAPSSPPPVLQSSYGPGPCNNPVDFDLWPEGSVPWAHPDSPDSYAPRLTAYVPGGEFTA